MKIQYEEASIEDIILHWIKDYELPEGQSIIRHEWAANPATGNVVIKLIVKESTLSTHPVSDDQQTKDAALRQARDCINTLWVSHHANRCDAAIEAIDAALSNTKQKERKEITQ